MPQFAACACRAPQAETLLAWLNCLFYCLCSSLCPLTLQVLGFSYGLQPEQLSYLLSEAVVGGLALEAIEEEGEVARVLNDGDFQRRCAGSLAWLQGLDLDSSLELGVSLGVWSLDSGVWVGQQGWLCACPSPCSYPLRPALASYPLICRWDWLRLRSRLPAPPAGLHPAEAAGRLCAPTGIQPGGSEVRGAQALQGTAGQGRGAAEQQASYAPAWAGVFEPHVLLRPLRPAHMPSHTHSHTHSLTHPLITLAILLLPSMSCRAASCRPH